MGVVDRVVVERRLARGHRLDEARTRARSDDQRGERLRPGHQQLARIEPADHRRALDRRVRPPWLTWNLSLEDYLRSRMLEIVVHSDDLAVSVALAPPEWPEEVVAPVLGVLTTLAVRKHGVAAVLRTLARAERAPGSIAAI